MKPKYSVGDKLKFAGINVAILSIEPFGVTPKSVLHYGVTWFTDGNQYNEGWIEVSLFDSIAVLDTKFVGMTA